MAVAEADLREITGQIWDGMLGLPLADAEAGAPESGGRVLTGCVHITGDWTGAVTIDCPAALAGRASAVLLGVPEDACSDADLRDTVGELANMTGGNVKALLAGSCRLSLPAVTEGGDFRVTIQDSRVVVRAAFTSGDLPLRVTVYEQASGAGPAPGGSAS